MFKVHVLFHKDGDFLEIHRQPWWLDIFDWMTDLVCPCCSWRGFLSEKSELFNDLICKLHSKLINYSFAKSKPVYRVKIDDACKLSGILFKKFIPCWNNDCENCWHLAEDAFTFEGNDLDA